MNRSKRRYIATLAFVAAAILLVGYWLRPNQPTTDEQVQAPSQTELSRLTRITQRRSLDDITDYFGTVADEVQTSVVALPGLERSGLIWEPGVVLTARLEPRFPRATTLSTPDGDIGVAGVVAGPQIPLATVRMSDIQGLAEPRRRPAASVAPGTWMLAVWQRLRETHFVPAHFLNTAPIRCGEHVAEELQSNVSWTVDMAGGGLFDLDGSLIGVVLPCDDRFAALSVGSVNSMLREGRSVEGRLLGRYGIRFESLTENEQLYFGRENGVIIREIWTGWLADRAGLAPGDILVAINAEPIRTPDQLEPLADAVDFETFDVAVARGAEIVTVLLPVDEALLDEKQGEGAPGIVWGPPPSGHRIEAVVAGSPAEEAGIEGGDRLLRIDREEPQDFAQVQQVLGSYREVPVFLEIDRSGRRWGVLLP